MVTFTWHLRHPLSNIFAEFAHAAVSGLVSTADKTGRASFLRWFKVGGTYFLFGFFGQLEPLQGREG